MGTSDPPGDDRADGERGQPVPQFDLGFAPSEPANIDAMLATTGYIASGLSDRVRRHISREVAAGAVSVDGLNRKISARIADDLESVERSRAELGNRIATHVVGELSSTIGTTSRYGVWPDSGDGSVPDASVLEARGRLGLPQLPIPPSDDGRPWIASDRLFAEAVAEYRASVLPLWRLDYGAYAARLAALERRFPFGSSYLGAWRTMVQGAESSAGPAGFIARPSDEAIQTQASPPAAPQFIPGTPPGTGSPVPQSPPATSVPCFAEVQTPQGPRTIQVPCPPSGYQPVPPPPSYPTEPVAPAPEPPAAPAECLPICGIDKLVEAIAGKGKPAEQPKPEPREYCVWQSSESDTCYVLPAGDDPRGPEDKRLGCGRDVGELVSLAIRECCERKEDEEKEPGARRPLNVLPIQTCRGFTAATFPEVPPGIPWLSYVLGLRDEQGRSTKIDLGESGNAVVNALVGGLIGVLRVGADKLSDVLDMVLRGAACTSGENIGLVLMRAAVGFVSNFVGASLDQIRVPLEQNSNFLCPVALPDHKDATAAYLSNTIDEETFECWVRACGRKFPEWARVAYGQRAKWSPLQLAMLWLRDALTEQQLSTRLRELGFIDPQNLSELKTLVKQVPAPSDLVRMMVRDAGDAEIVARFGMDDQFNDKFAGRLKTWAREQSIDEDYMRYIWRAHWSIPAPGQLYTMYHRLRHLPEGDPRRVDEDTIRTALVQQDILPYWIDKFLAISFRPLRLIDAARAYDIGAIDIDGLKSAYRDIGYDDLNVETLAAFRAMEKRRKMLTMPEAKAFMTGAATVDELGIALRQVGATDDDIAWVDRSIRRRRRIEVRRQCVRQYRKRYMRGDIDRVGTEQLLLGQGLDPTTANELLDAWTCERDARGKEVSASQLGQLYMSGVISGADYVQRLEHAGYDHDDAVRLYTMLSQRRAERDRAQQIREIRQREAQTEKERRRIEQAEQRLKAQRRERERQAQHMRRVNAARERALIEAGAAYARRLDADLADSIEAARRLYRSLVSATTYTRDEIIRAVVVAGRSPLTESVEQWTTTAGRILSGELFVEPDSSLTEV